MHHKKFIMEMVWSSIVSFLNSSPKCTIFISSSNLPSSTSDPSIGHNYSLFYCFKTHKPCHRTTFFPPISLFLCLCFYYTLPSCHHICETPYLQLVFKVERNLSKDMWLCTRIKASDNEGFEIPRQSHKKRKAMEASTVKYWRSGKNSEEKS